MPLQLRANRKLQRPFDAVGKRHGKGVKMAMSQEQVDKDDENLESAATYLQYHAWKSLVEWLTAEVILCRPEDPFKFIGGLLRAKIKARAGKAYNPADNGEFVRACYALASEKADEHGRIRGGAQKVLDEDDSDDEFGDIDYGPGNIVLTGEVTRRVTNLERVLSASRRVSAAAASDVAGVAAALIEETTHLAGCARAQLYLLEGDGKDGRLVPCEASTGARLADASMPLSAGSVPAVVVRKGRAYNIPDAYKCKDFVADRDEVEGQKTTSMLGVPVIDAHGKPAAVLVACNKNDGQAYDRIDEEVMVVFAGQVGPTLTTAIAAAERVAAQARAQLMVEFLSDVCGADGGSLRDTRALVRLASERAMQILGADRCSFYLKDGARDVLWTALPDGTVQEFPTSAGILGFVATRGETINITDASQDPRFDKSHDLKSGYTTKTLLCVPLNDAEGGLVAVIQFLNKLDGGVFGAGDEDSVRALNSILGPILGKLERAVPGAEADGGGSEGKEQSITM